MGGWSPRCQGYASPKKKPQHKLTLGRGWRGSIFPKTDYLPSPHCAPPLSETSCSLGSCFDNADPQTQEGGWSVYVHVCVHAMVREEGRGSLIQEPSTCKSAQKHARLFFLTDTLGCWNRARLALNTSVRCRKPCSFWGLGLLLELLPFGGRPYCHVFPGGPGELLSPHQLNQLLLAP